ncbi:AMP-binding enzyme family protein [Mycobacterium avium subsp. avium 2285 (R)]|nr:AMP-binding enzyme family protein [Mycobacterium avium subsp. avium 2285 (R)]
MWAADDDAKMLEFQGTWFTWGHVRALSEDIERQLVSVGCAAGARVAVVLRNSVESVAALIAIIRGGRTLVTLSPLQPPDRLSADLLATGVDFVLAPAASFEQGSFTAAIEELEATAFSVEGQIVELRARGHGHSNPGDPEVQIEMLTSGTTGPAKRIPLTRRQLEASLGAAQQHSNRPDGSERAPLTGRVGLITLPIVHIGGLWSLLQALTSARPMVMLERFSLPEWHRIVKEHHPKLAGLPPPAIRTVLDSDIPREDLASIAAINAGTSPVEPALVDEFLQRYGIPILIVYGATEFAGAVAGWTLKDFRRCWSEKRGSVGRAFPGVSLRIVDDGGAPQPPGQTGRLQVASVQVSGGTGDWVTTSDLAHLDEDGFLYIDGRADDVIIRGGFKVSPETVVKALRAHDAVADAAVAGLPDPRLGHVPVAAVELRPNAEADPEDLRTHCRAVLTPYEVPTQVFVVEELPRGAALKVDRRRLIEMLEAQRNAGGLDVNAAR